MADDRGDHEGATRRDDSGRGCAVVAGVLTAVENGDVYRGGQISRCPIQSLFSTARFATLLSPQVSPAGDLFDRGRVAEIVTEAS